MSKKIAQLTKVIYHLNTKNEDHGFDMQELADTYESEIEQLLRNAAARLNAFKGRLEAARDDARFQDALGQVQLRYERERQVRARLLLMQPCASHLLPGVHMSASHRVR
jgi:Family with sequence similarity 184, A and B